MSATAHCLPQNLSPERKYIFLAIIFRQGMDFALAKRYDKKKNHTKEVPKWKSTKRVKHATELEKAKKCSIWTGTIYAPNAPAVANIMISRRSLP